jgi:DivIVA domain-containing protein
MRGYARDQVDAVVGRALQALNSGDAALRAAVRDELRATEFLVVLRGYDRSQVDLFLRSLAKDLEQPPGA